MKNQNFDKAKKQFEEGVKFFQLEDFGSAETAFLNSLESFPNRLSTISNLIKLYIKTNDKKKLSDILEKYKEFKNHNEFLFGQAYKFFFEKNIKESMNICKEILKDENLKSSVQDLIALNYKNEKNFLKALKVYKNKIQNNRNNFMVYYNIGCLFFDLGKINQAYYFFKKSNKLNPNDNPTWWNMALCALTLKDLKKGFDLYEYRWKKANPDKKKFEHINSPKSPEQITDKKILIWDEQGLGDAINFSRFVIDLLKYTSKITLVVNEKLREILSNLHPKIIVVDYRSLNEKEFDFQLSICSLPKFLKVSSTDDIHYYKLNLKNHFQMPNYISKKKLNVGLAWSGNPKYAVDEYRSISFNYFKEILNPSKINFFRLSQDSQERKTSDLSLFSNSNDYGKKSLFEVANLMNYLDFVISSDTSIIHLAGILEVKSILLLNYNSDWRWFDDKEKTVWYPSVKIIKQKKFDTWGSVFDELKEEIQRMTNLSKKKGQ